MWTDEKEVTAQTVIIATGAVAKRLPFKGSDEVRRLRAEGVRGASHARAGSTLLHRRRTPCVHAGV